MSVLTNSKDKFPLHVRKSEEFMKIAVYLGSSSGIDEKYSKLTKEIGNWLVEHKHTLVYGAGSKGLMGVLADTVHQKGGRIIGVMPEFLLEQEKLYPAIDELYMVDTMSKRKQKMIDEAESFIALPGGPGTLEEVTEIISLIRLNRISGSCVLWNLDGYYQPLKDQLDRMIECGFLSAEMIDRVYFITSMDELDAIFLG